MAAAIVDSARRGWSAVADVDGAFAPGRLMQVERAESRIAPAGWVGVVALGDSCLAISPTEAGLHAVSAAARNTPLPDLPHVSWPQYGASEVLGPAALYFGQVVETAPTVAKSTVAGDERIARLTARVPPADAKEASLDEISSPAFYVEDDHEVVAVAGYQPWPGRLAHLCVLTAPECRRRGFARRVATAAIQHATGAGLLAQWRARPRSSQLLAESLGLIRVGAQVSFRLSE